jgi:Na+-driven multidrug efflux pump
MDVLVKNGVVLVMDPVLLNTYADLGRAGAAYASATAENTGSCVGAVCGDAEQRGGRYMDVDAGTWMWMRVLGVGRGMVGVGMGVAVTSVVLHTNKLKRPGNSIVI